MECPGLSALCGTWYTSRPPWKHRVHLCRKVNCLVEISQTLGRMSSSLVAVESSIREGVLEMVLWLTVVVGILIKWKEITEIYIIFVPENHELSEYVFPLKCDSVFRRLNMSTNGILHIIRNADLESYFVFVTCNIWGSGGGSCSEEPTWSPYAGYPACRSCIRPMITSTIYLSLSPGSVNCNMSVYMWVKVTM